MPEPTKIPRPFADSGDKNSIPDSSGGLGFASWQEGFPAITGTPFAQGGVAPKRADFNGIFNALSAATIWQQQGGFYAYDNTTDYEVGNVVEYNNDLYKCITANGPGSAVKAPTDTTVWDKVMTSADVQAGYLPTSTLASGTWTPVLYGDTTEGVVTYLGRQGTYRKIGNVCFIAFRIDISGYTTLPAGKVRIKGIPYAANNNSGAYNFGCVVTSGAGAYQKLRAGVVRDSFIGIRAVDASNFQIIEDATWGANASDTGGLKIFPTSGTIFGFASYFTA